MSRKPRVEIAGYYHIVNRGAKGSGERNRKQSSVILSPKETPCQENQE